MTKVNLGYGANIDTAKLIAGRMLITANSGGGKSWTVRRLCERTFDSAQQIILDWDGEYHTLREEYDYLLFGKDGDAPADIKNAAMLARKILELGTSAIIDIYELGQQRQLFVQRFLDALVNAPRELWHPVLIVVDEAHKLCPEGTKSISANAVIDLATLGRKRGFACVLATQRLAKLNKDAAAECNNVLIGRTGLDVDMKRASESLGFTTREDRLSLRSLGEGEFYGYGPAFDFDGVHKFKVGDVKTTHLRAGEARSKRPPPPSSKIKKVLGELKDLPREAEKEATTVTELQAQVRSLRAELARKPAEPKPAKPTIEVVEKPVMSKRELNRLIKVGGALVTDQQEFIESIKSLTKIVGVLKGDDVQANAVNGHGHRPRTTNDARRAVPAPTPIVQPAVREVRSRAVEAAARGDGSLPRGEIAILTALIQNPEGCSASQLTALTGYTQTSRDAYITRLSSKGLVMRDRPGHAIAIQPAASEALPNIKPLPTGDELRSWWMSRLPRGEAAVFQTVINAYPETIHVSKITEITGYTQTSRDAYITRMASKQIVERVSPGVIKASPNLFD